MSRVNLQIRTKQLSQLRGMVSRIEGCRTGLDWEKGTVFRKVGKNSGYDEESTHSRMAY